MRANSPYTILIKEKGKTQVEYTLETEKVVIGRVNSADIELGSKFISGKHCQLRIDGDKVTLEDMGSTNGTFVNNKKISKPTNITPGDVIQLGRDVYLQLIGRIGEDEEPKIPYMIVVMEKQTAISHPLTSNEITIGRSQDNFIAIASSFVSREHAIVRREEDGWHLYLHPEATNTIYVNENKLVDRQKLNHEDVLNFGGKEKFNTTISIYFMDSAQEYENGDSNKLIPSWRKITHWSKKLNRKETKEEIKQIKKALDEKYKIFKTIRTSKTQFIFLAVNILGQKQIALKVLLNEFTTIPRILKRFVHQGEYYKGAKLEHVVPVIGHGQINDIYYLAFPYMPGGSVAVKLLDEVFSLDMVRNILTDIAKAVDGLHQEGIIHRNIKPSNILFDQFGKAHLSDLDIALTPEMTPKEYLKTISGTPAYMSPEQAKGSIELTPASDIYSLGVVLFEMLTGSVPFYSKDNRDLMKKHINDPIPKIMEYNIELPEDLQSLIEKALAKDPAERYPNAASLAQAFSEIVEEEDKFEENISPSAIRNQPIFYIPDVEDYDLDEE